MSATLLTAMALEADPNLPSFFLARLASLATRHAASASPKERAALSVAMFSVYLDCLDLGLGEEAQKIISGLRQELVERTAA